MSRSASDAGFTLVELLVVMSIMALLAVLLVPNLTSRANDGAASEARRLIDTLNAQRLSAGAEQAQSTLLPEGARWEAGFPESTAGPAFHADGSANGGTIILADGKRVRISWIDGHAALVR